MVSIYTFPCGGTNPLLTTSVVDAASHTVRKITFIATSLRLAFGYNYREISTHAELVCISSLRTI